MIRDPVVRWPNRREHDGNALRTVSTLNAKPEHSKDGSGDDTEVTEVVSKARPHHDREWDVKFGSNCSVENHGNGDARSADNHNRNRISPC